MPCLISGGKISAVIFESFAETEASFIVAPPFDGEILIPFIPKGIICDMKILKGDVVVSETKAINIRELNAMPVSNSVLISRRIDGSVILKIINTDWTEPVEVKIKCIASVLETEEYVSLVFPGGYGERVMADVSVETSADVLKVESPTHKIVSSVSGKAMLTEACININGESLVLNIFRKRDKKGNMIISRRIFGDNLAYCTFAPSVGNKESVNTVSIKPIGGIGVKSLKSEAEYKLGEGVCCFALHTLIPPKGIRIKDKESRKVEEIYFESVSSKLCYMPVEIMYAKEKIKILQNKMENAPYEERCIIREEINDICIKYKIALGDIGLVNIFEGHSLGNISEKYESEKDSSEYLFESTKINPDIVIERILNSQTVDGVIGETEIYEENMLVFSTAVCLIALCLYTGDKYGKFAERSLDFLKGKKGYWTNTALKLWNGENIDIEELNKKADMKIMCRRLDELAVLIIKNFRRK